MPEFADELVQSGQRVVEPELAQLAPEIVLAKVPNSPAGLACAPPEERQASLKMAGSRSVQPGQTVWAVQSELQLAVT